MEKLETLHSDIFENISTLDLENGNVTYKTSTASSKITRKVAIDFSLWQQTGDCIWICTDEDDWVNPFVNEKNITTEELFDEFLKTYEI